MAVTKAQRGKGQNPCALASAASCSAGGAGQRCVYGHLWQIDLASNQMGLASNRAQVILALAPPS